MARKTQANLAADQRAASGKRSYARVRAREPIVVPPIHFGIKDAIIDVDFVDLNKPLGIDWPDHDKPKGTPAPRSPNHIMRMVAVAAVDAAINGKGDPWREALLVWPTAQNEADWIAGILRTAATLIDGEDPQADREDKRTLRRLLAGKLG
jgi:hypothetical protein